MDPMDPMPFWAATATLCRHKRPPDLKAVNAGKNPVRGLLLEITLQFKRALSGCTILSGLG